MKRACLTSAALILLLCSFYSGAQQTLSTNTNVPVPPLVNFSGTLTDVNGKPITGVAGVTFLLYKDQQGGSPLWMETQNVQPDNRGHYTVMLGSTSSAGLPSDIFVAGEAHWLAVQVEGQEEQPRVLLLSVPYALKAGDAATIGGLPPSAFMLAAPAGSDAASTISVVTSAPQGVAPTSGTITGTGTVDFIPLWDSTSDIISSVLFQSGSGSTARIGINTATPASTLDIKGGSTVRGTLSLPATGAATATAGKNSQPLTLAASAFNSTTSTAVNQVFQWQAEPASNDTAAPSGTLNLLFGEGATRPAETGLSIASNGQITFAAGQAFPGTGTGNGTITGVTAGTDLTGGGTGGAVTLNVDTTQVPQLNAANTFTGNQTANGNLTATGVVSGSSYQIGSNLFGFGSYANYNAFLGFAGNSSSSNTGVSNTASGVGALADNTTGSYNAASGVEALYFNTTGSYNTASGVAALNQNTTGIFNTAAGYSALNNTTTGSYNTGMGWGAGGTGGSDQTGNYDTALGYQAFLSTGTLNNATAIGANAEVSASNAMVLGSINGVNGATATVHVGIGTTAPQARLDVAGNSVETLIGDPGCGTGFAGLGFVGSGGFSSCKNYALIGDLSGNTYIGSFGSGTIYFRNQNGANLMTINPSGDVNIKGNLSKGGGSFKIDHPLDPANKYFYHSFVESPDMMNVYNGNVVTNRHAVATVTLPDYFEALNRDFRYQLTVIGQFAQAIVAKEISGNRFMIRTSKPGVKVSWQVTGIRHDAYADAHRIEVEVEKPPQEQGHYLHPELFGAPPEQAVGYNVPASPTQAEGAPVSALQALPLTAQDK